MTVLERVARAILTETRRLELLAGVDTSDRPTYEELSDWERTNLHSLAHAAITAMVEGVNAIERGD